MTLRYTLLGRPGNLREFVDKSRKTREINSNLVNVSIIPYYTEDGSFSSLVPDKFGIVISCGKVSYTHKKVYSSEKSDAIPVAREIAQELKSGGLEVRLEA